MRLFSYLRWGSRCCFFQRKIEVPQRCKSALQLEDAKQNQRVIQAVASVTTVDGHVTVQADSCWFAERSCESNESWWRSWIKLRSKGSWVVRPFNMTSHHRILDAALDCFSTVFCVVLLKVYVSSWAYPIHKDLQQSKGDSQTSHSKGAASWFERNTEQYWAPVLAVSVALARDAQTLAVVESSV